MPNAESDPLLFVFFNEIGIIEQLSRAELERRLPDGLKISHFGVLNHFARRGGEQNHADLARAFQVTKGAMTNTIRRLKARGLVEVRPDPSDGRGKLVRMSDEGRRVHDDSVAAVGPLLAEIERVFPRGQFARALPFLQELRAYLDRARDGAT